MDEKLQIIHNLETKNKQYLEEKSFIAKKYQSLKQQFLNMVVIKLFLIRSLVIMINLILNISLKLKIDPIQMNLNCHQNYQVIIYTYSNYYIFTTNIFFNSQRFKNCKTP